MKVKQLVRNDTAIALKNLGLDVKGKILEGEEHKNELCSLFWQEYKDTLNTSSIKELLVHYADMLEVIRTLMVMSKTNVKDFDLGKNPAMQWYKKSSPNNDKLFDARLDILQKFSELLTIKTEAIKDQLNDILMSFKSLVEAHGLTFAQVEKTRRTMFKKLGGFNQGTYLMGVSKAQTI